MRNPNPFRTATDWGDWLLGAVFAVSAVAALLWAVAWATAHGDLSSVFEPAPRADSYESTAMPDRSSGARVDSRGAASGTVAVFKCTQGGHTTYSDQPCGGTSEVREIDLGAINTYTPVGLPVQALGNGTRAPIGGTPRAAPVYGPTAEDDVCAAIQAEIDAIDTRMRAGYRSAEGERLRARWHDAKRRYHDAGCTWSTR